MRRCIQKMSEMQLVVFKLNTEEYAVSILQVQEIKRMMDITRVPQTPDYLKGVMNLRGNVLPVVDLKKRLDLNQSDYTDDTRIIIVKVDEIIFGIIVDSVSEVLSLNEENIEPPNTVVGGVTVNYLSGVGKLDERLLILLNLAAIIGVVQEAV